MWQDLRLAVRNLAKNPGFAAVAIAALALGIGANATVFSLVNAILFKNLAFADSDRVLYVTTFNPKNPRGNDQISLPNYHDLRAQAKSFESLGAYTHSRANLSDDRTTPESYSGSRITANGFPAIGQHPILGRSFVPGDEKPGAEAVIVLSYSLWDNRYARDPAIVGRQIRVNSKPATVIGVMQRGLEFPVETSFWLPLTVAGTEKRQDRDLSVFGRLRPGTTREAAGAELATLGQNLAAQYAEANQDLGYRVLGFHERQVRGQIRVVFLALLGAVGFVLLIACANVANLMLARAVGRAREISIRAALGAGRWRVVRQLLVESLLLSSVGGVLALGIANWGIRAFDAAVVPTGKPAWIDFTMDYRAFGFLAGISFLAAILFGLVPALRLARLDVNTALKDGGRAGAVRGEYLSGVLVVVEMTLAVVLLTGAGLMIRSFLRAYNLPAGADTSNILTMQLDLPETKYAKPEQRLEFQRSLVDRVRALPGVETATVNFRNQVRYELEGVAADPKDRPSADVMFVGDRYFEILRVAAARGRLLATADHTSGPPVVVVNQTFATRIWPGEDPVGKRLRIHNNNVTPDWMTVVGMAPDFLQNPSQAQANAMIYVPVRFDPRPFMTVMARTHVPPASLAQPMRRAAQEVDADLPVRDVLTVDEQIALQYWPLRVFGAMFSIFAGVALLLATVGLYAVVAYGVNQRTQEIGIRVALGASAGNILRMVFHSGMRQMAIGLVLGLAAAFAITRVLSTILVGVSPTDPLTFSVVAGVLIGAAALGCAIPARRAMRVDPAIALRHE